MRWLSCVASFGLIIALTTTGTGCKKSGGNNSTGQTGWGTLKRPNEVKIKKGGQAFFRQGRSIAGKVVHEAVNTTAESIEREGLSPDRLGKKVKKVLGNVREAVSNAIEED